MPWRLDKRDDWPAESRQFSLLTLFGLVTFLAFAAGAARLSEPTDSEGIWPAAGYLLVLTAILAAPAVAWSLHLLEPRRVGVSCLMLSALLSLLMLGFALMPGVGRMLSMILFNLALNLGALVGREQRLVGYRLVQAPSQADSPA